MTKVASVNTILTVSGIDVQVVRKDIKNLHLAVYPPEGHVRVAVPNHITDENVRLAVIQKLAWIKKQQIEFSEQPRQSKRKYISGECHYAFGVRFRLELIEQPGKSHIVLINSNTMKMYVPQGASVEIKERLINDWYRAELKKCVPELLEKWQPIIGKKVSDFTIRKMKTKWGSCNIQKRRICLNLELAKKPLECIEYILVHEMVHLLERNHNHAFKKHMDKFLPKWRTNRGLLNSAPLVHEDWLY